MTSIQTINERLTSYQDLTDYKLLPKLPIITIINGRSFKKLTSTIQKPFSLPLAECFYAVSIKLLSDVDGSVFAYHFNDEIILISRNDQHQNTSQWFNGSIQKISSAISSIATSEFDRVSKLNDLPLVGNAWFIAHTFCVPSSKDAVSLLVSKQKEAILKAINFTCFYELIKHYDAETVRETLYEKSMAQKLDLLSERGISFDRLPMAFKNGIASYRIQKFVEQNDGVQTIRPKIILNDNLPVFSKDAEFLNSIIGFGKDIIRQ